MGLEDDSFAAFCQALELNGHLQHLDLSNNDLAPSNGVTLAEAIKNNGTVSFLDLRSNHLGCRKVSKKFRNYNSHFFLGTDDIEDI